MSRLAAPLLLLVVAVLSAVLWWVRGAAGYWP